MYDLCVVEWGHLGVDVYIRDIETTQHCVNSEKAHCADELDKSNIHNVILSSSSSSSSQNNGFDRIDDKGVERNQLEYLLRYPVQQIRGLDCDVHDLTYRYITILVYPLIIGMVSYPLGLHLCLVYLLARIMFSKESREESKEAVELLAHSITLMVERVYFIGDDDIVPNFEKYCKSWSQIYYCVPRFVFWKWRKNVDRLLKERNYMLKDNGDHTATNNVTANSSTPLSVAWL